MRLMWERKINDAEDPAVTSADRGEDGSRVYEIVAKVLLPERTTLLTYLPVARRMNLRVAAGDRVRAPAVSAPV